VRAALILLTSLFCLVACVTTKPPVDEYALARAAIEAAQNVQSARHSPGYWHQAEEAYRKGQLY
jgi:hypothetical protein